MKLDSKYFDRVRIKPDQERPQYGGLPLCEWPGCGKSGRYRAPKGRGREGEYYRYCLCHVREYNRSYNYFAGMSDAAISDFQKSAVTGHRPTWSTGVNGWSQARQPDGFARAFKTADPFEVFQQAGVQGAGVQDARIKPRRRPLLNAERRCLRTLGLEESASAPEIKAQYKALVKRHHPDSNGGDRASEDKLREVIQAYNHLKKAGLC